MRGARSDDRDPAESLMREVGAQLRQARLERGEDLNDAAQHLRIKSSYLFALEQGDLSPMPGRTYALGFLRSYADHLGFDGEDLIARIKSTVDNLTDRTSLRIRTPMPENRLPKTPVVVISLAVVAGVYVGWSHLNRTSRMVVDTVAEVPSELRARTLQALPRDAAEEPLVAGAPTEAAGGAAAPETAPGAEPSGLGDPPAPAAAVAAPSDGGESVLGAAGSAATPPGSAPPEAGPSVEDHASITKAVAPEALTRQTIPPVSSATSSAPVRSTATPTGRP